MRRIVFFVLVLLSLAAIYRLQREKAEPPTSLDPVLYFIGDRA